jgi:hypothetical protein
VAAFAFFGCVPREVWWDNPTTVVRQIFKGRDRRPHQLHFVPERQLAVVEPRLDELRLDCGCHAKSRRARATGPGSPAARRQSGERPRNTYRLVKRDLPAGRPG